eukprot:8088648-Pyramimonas_sp.AAC.2
MRPQGGLQHSTTRWISQGGRGGRSPIGLSGLGLGEAETSDQLLPVRLVGLGASSSCQCACACVCHVYPTK